MYSQDLLNQAIEHGVIDFCGVALGPLQVEFICLVLKGRGDVTVKGVGAVMSMTELGAYLARLVDEQEHRAT